MSDHGLRKTYTYGCRCNACRRANAVYQHNYRKGVKTGRKTKKQTHGTRSTYVSGCRCDPCVMANRNYQRDYMQSIRAVRDGIPATQKRRGKKVVRVRRKSDAARRVVG